MGQYNPNNPTVLGMELGPVVLAPVLLDTGTEIGYKFIPAGASTAVKMCRLMTSQPPPGQALRKCLTATVVPHDSGPSTGNMRKLIIPVSSGALLSGASNVGGATVADCVRNPSDSSYTALAGASAGVRLWFDTNSTRISQVLSQARIFDVTVRYGVTGPFDTLPSGLVLSLERPSASVIFDMDNALYGPVNNYDNVIPRRSRLGDLNPFWSTLFTPNTNYERVPWHYGSGGNNHVGLTQLVATGGTNINVRFSTSAAATGLEFRIQYAALEITYGSESRSAAGGVEIGPGAVIRNDLFTYDIPVGSMYSYGYDGFAQPGELHDVVVGQGYCGALSVAYPVPLSVDRISAGQIYGPHEGIILRKTLREGERWTQESTDPFPAIALYSSDTVVDATTIQAGTQTYLDQVVAPIDQLTFPDYTRAVIVDNAAGTYTHIRFYARVQSATVASLQAYEITSGGVSTGPAAMIDVASLLALPEINDGWRRVTLAFDTPIITTGTGYRYITFYTDAEPGAPWEILGADANPFTVTAEDISVPTYGGTGAAALIAFNTDFSADLSVMLVQAMPVPAGLAAITAVQPLSVVDTACGLPVTAIPTGIRYVQLTWTADNSVAVAGFAYYEVQRRDTSMAADEWESVAQVSTVSLTQFDDYEARIGIQSWYRIRFVHVDGYVSGWASTVTATIAAPGVTGVGVGSSVLVLTTNHDPGANLAYCQSWDGGGVPVQDFTFLEGSQTTLQPMYQRDYRVAFRPLERGGVEFTRTLLVNALGIPAETLSDGFSGLRDLAWDTVPYVCVRDELHNRWLTAVSVPQGTTRDVPGSGHLMLAQATFAEVTATPAPVDYDAPCEGLTLPARDNFNDFSTTVGTTTEYGTTAVTDTFTRTVSNGWGNATTGQAWTTTGGTAANYSVNGTQGVMAVTAVDVERTATLPTTWADYRLKTDVVLPALATGGPYVVSQVVRQIPALNLSDTWTRVVAAGWGTATSGQVWTVNDAASFSADGTRGRITMATVGRKVATLPINRRAADITVARVALNAAVTGTGGIVTVSVEIAKSADGQARLAVILAFPTSGNVTYQVVQTVAGNVVASSSAISTALTSATVFTIRAQVFHTTVRAKVYQNGTAEPGSWGATATTVTPFFDGNLALVAEKNASVTNATSYVEFDDLAAVTTGGPDNYRIDLICNTDATMNAQIWSRAVGQETMISTTNVPGTYGTATLVHMETLVRGNVLDSRVWPDAQPRPAWSNGFANGNVAGGSLIDVPVGGLAGLRAFRRTANSNGTINIIFDNVAVETLPAEWDARFLFRPIDEEWRFYLGSQAYSSSDNTGEWNADVSSATVDWYVNSTTYGQPATNGIGLLGAVKNRLSWVRMRLVPETGLDRALLYVYNSPDNGATWDLKYTIENPTGIPMPPMPADAVRTVQVYYPAESVWVHKVELRIDGVLVASPDFAAQPEGTTSFADGQGHVWTGDALC